MMIDCEPMAPVATPENPFNTDMYHMGTYVAKNVCVMYATFEDQVASYIIVVNRETGERIKIRFYDGSAVGANMGVISK